jgi:hypothetical protein
MNTTAKSNRTKKSARAAAESPATLQLARAVGCGLLAAIACGLVLSLVAAGIAYASADPDALILPLALGILGLTSLICGFVTRRVSRLPLLPSGGSAGLALLLLSFVLSYPFGGEPNSLSPTHVWVLRGGIVALTLLGAAMGATLPKKRRKGSKRK